MTKAEVRQAALEFGLHPTQAAGAAFFLTWHKSPSLAECLEHFATYKKVAAYRPRPGATREGRLAKARREKGLS